MTTRHVQCCVDDGIALIFIVTQRSTGFAMSSNQQGSLGRPVAAADERMRRLRLLLDAGEEIEDDEVARQKMRDAHAYERGVDGIGSEWVGFDPDNAGDVKYIINSHWPENNITPMGYFARRGDLPMMRWLYVNGADTRGGDVHRFFPMLMAAISRRTEACKWLFAHGAAEDVKRRSREEPNGRSPLRTAFCNSPIGSLSRWLILNGALCTDDGSGELDPEAITQDLVVPLEPWNSKHRNQGRKALLEWATDLHGARTSFLLFLSGALPPPHHTGIRKLLDMMRCACSIGQVVQPLHLLVGKPGVLELVGDYVGVVRGREARIIRQLTEVLPVFAHYLGVG